jgi:hypothetical protein
MQAGRGLVRPAMLRGEYGQRRSAEQRGSAQGATSQAETSAASSPIRPRSGATSSTRIAADQGVQRSPPATARTAVQSSRCGVSWVSFMGVPSVEPLRPRDFALPGASWIETHAPPSDSCRSVHREVGSGAGQAGERRANDRPQAGPALAHELAPCPGGRSTDLGAVAPVPGRRRGRASRLLCGGERRRARIRPGAASRTRSRAGPRASRDAT